MDTMITGVKGSGKTYYAVEYISRLKDQSKVLHNIKGLSLGQNIYDLAKDWNLQEIDFFRDSLHDEDSPKHDKRFETLHGYLFVIDECQKLFPKNFKNQDVDQFFQMARHYDIDTFLLSQDEKLVAPSIKVHPELFLRAISDTANPLPGFFLYRKMVGWEQVGLPIRVRKKQKVFDLYKSADTKTGGKITRKKARPMLIMFGVAIVCGVISLGYFKYYTSNRSDMRGHSPSSFVADATRDTFASQENVRKRSRFSQQDQTETAQDYPQSLLDKIGGVIVPVSVATDSNGRYVIFLDVPYSYNMFPYRIINNKFGNYAIVPIDVFQYYEQQIIQAKSIVYTDPNQPYYWNESTTKEREMSN